MPSRHELLLAYRSLYKTSLHAVRYSSPAKYVLRDRLRRAFRDSHASDFDAKRIKNTIKFLKAAASDTGIEHKVLKNLSLVWYAERDQWRERDETIARLKRQHNYEFALKANTQAYDHFYHVLTLLNESMGLCLR